MKKFKESNKGITLIALVITIIILLILAGLTISSLTGSGLFQKAGDAEIKTRAASAEEQVTLWKGENFASSYTKDDKISAEKMLEDLKSKKLVYEEEIDRDNEVITIKKKDGTVVKEISYKETQILGKLSDIVKVGDYINYAPTYTNISTVKEGIGNGWRVAYVDSTSGVVTLISEGVPLSTEVENPNSADAEIINFDSEIINKKFDNTVADNIDILTLEDIQLLCTQANYVLTHNEAVNDLYKGYVDENYNISEDNLNIINIGTDYVLNTIATSRYGDGHYLIRKENYWKGYTFGAIEYSGDIGVRLVVELKSDLEYYGGTGTQGNPYQIY